MANELLYFLASKFHNLSRSDIRTARIDFYQEEEILVDKMLLIKCVNVSLHSAVRPTQFPNKSSAVAGMGDRLATMMGVILRVEL